MCRVLAYSGPPVLLDNLLFKPDSSLVRQAYDPQQLHMLNLGGFGMLAWDTESANPHVPWTYRSTELPVFDANLKALSEKAHTTCLLAHIRGIAYRSDAGFGPHNLHPFQYEGCRWAMAHNGDLSGHNTLKHEALLDVPPELREQMRGTTDSETIYALVMANLSEPRDVATIDDLYDATVAALTRIRELRNKHDISRSSSMNLFFTDGESTLALRFTFDFGCYSTEDPSKVHEANLRYLSLWYTAGERYDFDSGEWRMTGDAERCDAILLASEPLSRDISGWVEVPEYSALLVDRRGGGLNITTRDLDV